MYDRSKALRDYWSDPDNRAKMRKRIAKGIRGSRKMRTVWKKTKALWQDPAKRRLRIKRMRAGCKLRNADPEYQRKNALVNMRRFQLSQARRGGGPNKLERRFKDLVRGSYLRYRGDGARIVAGHCPDFIIAKSRRIVEVFGDYWHRDTVDKDRQKLADYRKAGWKVLVIWESDIEQRPDVVRRTVLKFIGRSRTS